MSCETNLNGVGKAAGGSAGVPALVSKASHMQAVVMAKTQQAVPVAQNLLAQGEAALQKGKANLAQSGAVVGYVTGVAGPENRNSRQQKAGRRLGMGVKGALTTMSFYNPSVILGYMFHKKIQGASTLIGSSLAGFTKTADAGTVSHEKRRFLVFKSHQDVPLWKSSLTARINKGDLVVPPNRVVSSDGTMFKAQNMTWHRGTTVMKTDDGQRTISHLQSLNLPATHYYFDQPLSDEKAVGLAMGTVKPESLPGYVGHVGSFEGLSPLTARAKHWMIKSYLFYGPRTPVSAS